jgi:hypothetical protein
MPFSTGEPNVSPSRTVFATISQLATDASAAAYLATASSGDSSSASTSSTPMRGTTRPAPAARTSDSDRNVRYSAPKCSASQPPPTR